MKSKILHSTAICATLARNNPFRINMRTTLQRIFFLTTSFGISLSFNAEAIPTTLTPKIIVSTNEEPVASGKFQPTWQSLKQYQTPQWFRDAKFGIWAHWGPQCQPEDGDWYAREMYQTGSAQHRFHTNHYGSPLDFGFKDVIREWHAEN